MSDTPSTAPLAHVASIAHSARKASRKLALLSGETRKATLLAIADALERNGERILAANAKDCAAAEKPLSRGEMPQALFSRLRIKESGIPEMAARVREVANLPDPLGKRLAATELDQDLILHKESCPLGVIAVVFESRPDVLPQVASLALKSGNAVLLKGGTEAANSNESIVAIWREALSSFPDVPQESIQLLQSRSDVRELLGLHGEVDLLIPRGSKEFVAYLERNSHIPVLGHGEGICHVFVDSAADLNKAVSVTLDSKVQYPAACNSAAHSGLSRQLSLLPISELSDALSCRTGSARAVPTNPADCKDGPIPRIATRFGELPVIMNPPIATSSPVSTCKRVEMFNGWAATGARCCSSCSSIWSWRSRSWACKRSPVARLSPSDRPAMPPAMAPRSTAK